jgi:hypothetical protein
MGETPSEASALLQAIGTLLPYANGAAGDVIPPLRKALALLITDDHAPTKAPTEATPSLSGATTPLRPPKPAKRAAQAGAMRVGKRRLDPKWPGIRDRVHAAMTARATGPTELARVAGIPVGTLRKYLGETVPPPDVRARLVAWVDRPAAASPEASAQPRAPRVAPPSAKPREDAAPPPVPFPRAGTQYRMGATETAARA